MTSWKTRIDPGMPCWDGYRAFLEALPEAHFPSPGSLNDCLLPATVNHEGRLVRFVPASALPGVDYERHVFETGQVPTRENSWHDLFNALVWCRLPRLKSAMNRLHHEQLENEKSSQRGALRDALTLLDESGIIVSGTNAEVLQALARHDWKSAFVAHRSAWDTDLQILVCGHANLEKFLDPYKSQAAHALLVLTPGLIPLEQLDEQLANSLAEHGWLKSPSSLSPLPLAGIPGWWSCGKQDREFYDDPAVFRPPSPERRPAPVHIMQLV